MLIEVAQIPNNLMGIYKITYPNGKIYIGMSGDIKRRMWEHNNPNANKSPCDQAINKYGKIKEIEILEIVNDYKFLGEREQYWIEFYKANNKEIGYNLTIGGDTAALNGEYSPVAVFTNDQVLDIRRRRFEGERKKDVYSDYTSYAFGTFEKVWLGRGYPEVGQEYLIQAHTKTRRNYSSEANAGIKNGRAKCSIDDVLTIRQLYDSGKSFTEIHKLYPNLSKSSIRRIALKESYKNI